MPELLIRRERFENRIESFGFEYLSFQVRRLAAGKSYTAETGGRELAAVMLGGRCTVETAEDRFEQVGGRAHVFAGLPHAVYLPLGTAFTITAETDAELALCYSRAEQRFPPRLVTPADIRVEIRGGGNATRQILHILEPEFPAHRLLVCEVYTPSGNWSSYPPHKHDEHRPPQEVDLEEIYYYRIDRPEGFAIQRVYTRDGRIDALLAVRDSELVLVPEGYHPVVAAPGYNVYYLNALAGSARSMAASDDPDHAWVRGAWKEKDPRLPLVR
jgi:5-deoxy-glucuronate isomerase